MCAKQSFIYFRLPKSLVFRKNPDMTISFREAEQKWRFSGFSLCELTPKQQHFFVLMLQTCAQHGKLIKKIRYFVTAWIFSDAASFSDNRPFIAVKHGSISVFGWGPDFHASVNVLRPIVAFQGFPSSPTLMWHWGIYVKHLCADWHASESVLVAQH